MKVVLSRGFKPRPQASLALLKPLRSLAFPLKAIFEKKLHNRTNRTELRKRIIISNNLIIILNYATLQSGFWFSCLRPLSTSIKIKRLVSKFFRNRIVLNWSFFSWFAKVGKYCYKNVRLGRVLWNLQVRNNIRKLTVVTNVIKRLFSSQLQKRAIITDP